MDKDLTIIYGIWITAFAVVLALPLIMASPGPGDWWNENYEERYLINRNNSGYLGICSLGANVTGMYGTCGGDIATGNTSLYNSTDTTNDYLVANNTDELCWFDTQNNRSNCPKKTGSAESLQAYYSLDRSSGSVMDYIENNHGTTNAIRGVTGQVEDAFDFDGTDDNVSLGTDKFQYLNDFSVSLWFNADDLGSGELNDIYSVGCDRFTIRIDDNGNLFVGWYSDSYNSITKTISIGTWYHVVTVADSTDGKYLYVDGVEEGHLTNTDDVSYVSFDTCFGGGWNDNYDGKIDDARIWNRSLSSTEIENQFNSTNEHLPYLEGVEIQVIECTFNGSVKDLNGNAISGARVVIEEAETDKFVVNTTTDANGLWNSTVTGEGNYTVYAYEPGNNSRAGDIKPYVECI